MRKIIINTLAIFVTISLHTHAQKRGEVPTFQWGTTGKQIDLSWAAEVGSRVEDNQSTNTFKVKDFRSTERQQLPEYAGYTESN